MTDKNFIITVNQRGVLTPRLYKMRAATVPTIQELIDLGADIFPPRQDKVAIDAVSDALYNAVNTARWLRPSE